MSSVSAPPYAGRHRFGHPGLVYCRAVLTRAGLRRTRRWFGLRFVPARHGGRSAVTSARPAASYSPSTRPA